MKQGLRTSLLPQVVLIFSIKSILSSIVFLMIFVFSILALPLLLLSLSTK